MKKETNKQTTDILYLPINIKVSDIAMVLTKMNEIRREGVFMYLYYIHHFNKKKKIETFPNEKLMRMNAIF